MKMELTESDIFLLKLACSGLIAFFVIRFLLMPGIDRFQENTIQNEALEETVSEMEAAIEGIPMLEKSIEERMESLAEISEPFYERMENRQVDELLTGLALKHGLFPVSLSIDGAKAAIPEPYLYGQVTENTEMVTENYIQTAVGHMVLQGEEGKFFTFLDDVEENYPALKLRFLRRDEKIYFDEDFNMLEQPDMSCDLAIYMYDKSALESSLTEELTPEAPAGDEASEDVDELEEFLER